MPMSMINPAMIAKKERLELIKNTLEELMPVQYRKAVAIICMNTGLSERTAKEHVMVVVNFNDWIVKDGLIQKTVLA